MSSINVPLVAVRKDVGKCKIYSKYLLILLIYLYILLIDSYFVLEEAKRCCYGAIMFT